MSRAHHGGLVSVPHKGQRVGTAGGGAASKFTGLLPWRPARAAGGRGSSQCAGPRTLASFHQDLFRGLVSLVAQWLCAQSEHLKMESRGEAGLAFVTLPLKSRSLVSAYAIG